MPKDKKKENIYEVAYDDMATFEVFFAENWKKIFQFCAVVVIVIAVYMLAKYYNNRHEAFIAGEISKANSAAELQAAISNYGTYPAADSARLRLAQIYFKDKKYDEAYKLYTDISFSKDAEISLRAKLNLAYIMEVQGKKNEAAAKFAEFSARIGLPEDVRFEAAYNAARVYKELGEAEKARSSLETFNNIDAQMANNFWAEKAQRLKTLIK